jgi:hypothetical protein
MRMHERDYPEALAEIPQAAAVAGRIKAERGFDPLDPSTLEQAILGYRKSRANVGMWGTFMGFPLAIVIIGATISVSATGAAVRGGLLVLVIGIAAFWFPARKMARSYRVLNREVRPVIKAYEEVLVAAQPDPHHGRTAVNRWRRRNGLR